MKQLTTARFGAALLGCLLLLTSASWADSHARIVRLSYVQGAVDINRGQGMDFERGILNMPLVEGSQVWTRDGGVAEIEFEDGSTVRLAPGSRLEFTALSLRDSGGRVTTLGLSEGTAYVDVPHLDKGDEFTLQLPNRDLTLTHSVRFRVEMDGSEARLAVMKGELDLAGSERNITVKKNETVSLDLGDANRYDLMNSIQPLSYDGWNNERAKVHDSYVSSAGQNGYAYGLADLSYYGNTIMASGCGYGWRPFGAGLNWDPWGSGAWTWYPGYGYVWVSGYPWGWMPYRYGSWTFVSNAGWTWCSQNMRWNEWNTIPVIITAPPNYVRPHPPLTIATGNGTTIWVGKGGPGERERALGNSLVGDQPGGRRQSNPRVNNTVVFGTGQAVTVTPSDAGGRISPRDRQIDPRGRDPHVDAGNAQGRWQQAPMSRTESPRNNPAPASRTESPRFNQPAPQMHSAPAPSPRTESPRFSQPAPQQSAPAPSPHTESPRSAPPPAARSKQ